MSAQDSGQAGALSHCAIEVTPEMIEAGLFAYRANASHDEFSWLSPSELVELILRRALQSQVRR